MTSELALQVAGFVLADDILTTKTVEELVYFGERSESFSLVGHFADATHSIAAGLSPIAVLEATLGGLADTFFR